MNTLAIGTKVQGIGSQSATYYGRTGELKDEDCLLSNGGHPL